MSITRKYILLTFLLIFVLGCIMYLVELTSVYNRELKAVNQQLEQIRDSHIPFLISSLWLTNYDLLQQQIDAIERFPNIAAVTVSDDEGNLYTAGNIYAPGLTENREILTYTYQGKSREIGELIIYIDELKVKREVFLQEAIIIVFHFFLAILMAAMISYLFHTMVGRHIRYMSQFLRSDTYANLDIPFSLARKKHNDELEDLSVSINTMRGNIRTYLNEKDLLLQEIHHRIKNNMFTIESLLSLQADTADDPKISEALNEAKGRLRSMGVLYDRLYRSGNITAVSLKEYLPPLIRDIIKLQTDPSTLQLETEVDDIVLDANTLSSLGILVNELLTNAVKYAFLDGRAGRIHISCISSSSGTLQMTYRDNGVGFPDEVIKGTSGGLGMILVRSLTEQLKGDLRMRNEGGALIEFRFQIDNPHDSKH